MNRWLYIIPFPFGMWAFLYIGAYMVIVLHIPWTISLFITCLGMGFTSIVCMGNIIIKCNEEEKVNK